MKISIECEFVEGSAGIFDIDGDVVFSGDQQDRFPSMMGFLAWSKHKATDLKDSRP